MFYEENIYLVLFYYLTKYHCLIVFREILSNMCNVYFEGVWGVGCGVRQKWDVIGVREVRRGSECSGYQILIFFIKENWICAMARHYAEPNINILETRNLLFYTDVRQWSHTLMIPLHCLCARSNNRTRGQFVCDVFWFWFRLFTCTLRLLFHSFFGRREYNFKMHINNLTCGTHCIFRNSYKIIE